MSERLPPLAQISPENHGPIVIVVSYTLIVITLLFYGIRILSGFTLKRAFGWDDILMVLAVAISLAESVLIEKAADNGLGRFIDRVELSQLELTYKFLYTSSLISIIAQACAKTSVVVLMQRLSAHDSGMHKFYPYVYAANSVWLIFSIFALAFQCALPTPWFYNSRGCTGSGALWYPVLLLDMITDGILSILFAPVIWKLQMKKNTRYTIIGLFGARFLVCAAEIAQLATLALALRAVDTTRTMTIPVIMGQVVLNLSILTAIIPSLHRFLNELHSQGISSAIPDTQIELSHNSRSGSYGWKKSKSKGESTKLSSIERGNSNSKKEVVDFRPDVAHRGQAIVSSDANQIETGSRTSDGSEDAIIRQTTTWQITYTDRAESPQHHSPHAR